MEEIVLTIAQMVFGLLGVLVKMRMLFDFI